MHKFLAIRLLLLCLLPVAHAADTDQMIRDAVSHHDQQEFAQAIELLEQVLELEPDNGTAWYELAFTHQANGDLKACVEVADEGTRVLQTHGEGAYLMSGLAMLHASCQSTLGQTDAALETFSAALERYPDDYGLNFNIAVTLINTGQLDAASQHLERAIKADPYHPSPYYVIGSVFRQQGQRIPALLAFLNFLQREYNSPRSEESARAVFAIALSHASADASGENSRSIQINASEVGDSADVMALSMAMSATVMAFVADGEIKEPLAESLASILSGFIGVTASVAPGSDEETLVSTYLMPGVSRIEQAEVTAAFAHYVAVAAGVPGAEQWLDDNPDAVDALVVYLNLLAEERPEAPL